MTLYDYFNTAWKHPDMDHRSVDKDGGEFYFLEEPKIDNFSKKWLPASGTAKRGRRIEWQYAREFWSKSLQSYKEYSQLKNK